MKHGKRALCSFLAALLVCSLIPMTAFASSDVDTTKDTGAILAVDVLDDSADDTVAAEIITTDEVTVTDGVLKLTYDSSELEYVGVDIGEYGDYVAQFAENVDEEKGTVRISWVAPGVYEADPEGDGLFQVVFEGDDGSSIKLASAVIYDVNETTYEIGLDTAALEEAIDKAEYLLDYLNSEDYTEGSWKALEKALAEALAELEDALSNPDATQLEVDAETEALYAAIDALVNIHCLNFLVNEVVPCLDSGDYTEESWAGLEEALAAAKAVLNNADATQDEVEEAKAALLAALEALEAPETVEPDRTELVKAILTGGLLEEHSSEYTSESWAVLEAALAEAFAVLEDKNATQEEIDAAAAKLNAAIAALVKADSSDDDNSGSDVNSGSGDNSGSSDSGNSGTSSASEKKTGDESNYGLFIGLLICAAAAVAGALVYRNRRVRR